MGETYTFSDISDRTEDDLQPVELRHFKNLLGPRHLDHLKGVLVTEEDKELCLDDIAYRITRHYRELLAPDEAIILAPLLNGAMLFASDLMQRLMIPLEMDSLKIESYGGATGSSGEVKFHKDFSRSVQGRHVLLLEDIVDTGLTIASVRQLVRDYKNPASVSVCTFLDKAAARKVEAQLEFVGYRVPDMFVVGYGLDYQHELRNLPFVGVYEE